MILGGGGNRVFNGKCARGRTGSRPRRLRAARRRLSAIRNYQHIDRDGALCRNHHGVEVQFLDLRLMRFAETRHSKCQIDE